jgi:hypothetical protein
MQSLSSSSSIISSSSTLTLKEALRSFKSEEITNASVAQPAALNGINPLANSTLSDVELDVENLSSNVASNKSDIFADVENNDLLSNSSSTELSMNASPTPSAGKINEPMKAGPNEINNESAAERLRKLLANNQITKSKLDEASHKAKRINNNLKLYLIINTLNTDQNGPNNNSNTKDKKFEEDETLVCTFKLKYCISNGSQSMQAISASSIALLSSSFGSSAATNLASNTDTSLIENCLCVLTNKSIILLRITNSSLFEQNVDFDKCLAKQLSIDINQIEIIEVGMGQPYLIVEMSSIASTAAAKATSTKSNMYKFVTLDIYQTQTFLNILLSIIPFK